MKSFLINLLAVITLVSCRVQRQKIDSIVLLSEWEFKMISQGNNRPAFNPKKDSIQYIPILLHSGYSINEIQEYFEWSDEVTAEKCKILKMNGFIKKSDDGFIPSVMIFTEQESNKIREAISPVSYELTETMAQMIDTIKMRTSDISCFSKYEFDELSLLVLSNVLLDNGQIRNVENEYLKTERPNRNSRHYYAAYGQKDKGSVCEAGKIYGNQVEMHEGFALCRYGNQRYTDEVTHLNTNILNTYAKSKSSGDFKYPIITEDCNQEISELADFFKPNLLDVLNRHTPLLKEIYTTTGYSKEIDFEEYFIWAYHILYSDVTDRLIAKQLITLPDEKVSFYIFQP